MEPPDPSSADAFIVSQEYAVLVLDVRRAAVSFSFQVHCLQVLVEAGLIAFPNACFEFADEGPDGAQHGILQTFRRLLPVYVLILTRSNQ